MKLKNRLFAVFMAAFFVIIFPISSFASSDNVAWDVINDKYGSGAARKEALIKAGYDYDAVQAEVGEVLAYKQPYVDKMTAWAKKIAADDRYHYVKWEQNNSLAQTCPICKNKSPGKYFGWQCIGFGAAVWRHGGGLPIICKYSTISDQQAEKLLAAKTDAEALKLAQSAKYLNYTEITIIRNRSGVPKSKWQAGDMCLMFKADDPTDFKHIFYYAGGDKIIDATQSGGLGAKGNIAVRNYKNYRCSIIIRYSPKSIDTLAHEVLRGEWGSGQTRKDRLTKALYNYDKVQARVNEILQPTAKPYPGTMPTLKLIKTNAQVKADAVKWACWIAGDNRFHYGHGEHAHHNGCYFCGTQKLKKGHGITDYQFTYCCNPFVGAAWAHGGGIPKALSMCQDCNSWDFHKGAGYDKSSLFDNLGHPAKSKLQLGDVLCKDNHVAIYIGNGKIAEASAGDDNVRGSKKWNNSIHTTTLTDSRYNGFKRVHRYNSSVSTSSFIRYGELSYRVTDLQKYINWFYGKEVVKADGIFGDSTLAWVKQLQSDLGVTADGIVGNDTLTAMGKVVR